MKMNLLRALHKHSAVRAGVIASKRSARTLAAPWSAGLTQPKGTPRGRHCCCYSNLTLIYL